MKYQFLRLSLKSNRIRHYKLSCLFRIQKNYFFFYFTHTFLQKTYINLFILHIYSIKYSFLLQIIFYFLTHYFSLSQIQHSKNTKILNTRVTVIVHIYTVIIALVHFMHNFTPTYVSFFSLKMCKIDNFLYFAKFYMSVVALIFFF